ncbi:uncharacterized protein LOC144449968 [Glandiceps talaboti]
MDGNWSDENPTCYVNCEHEGQLYTQGSTRQEACNTCTCSNGVWACTQRICLPADCTDPGTPLNGQQKGSPTFKHGTNATFSCNTNFTLVGVATITCMDGTWSDEKPTCHADCMDPGTPTSGEQDDSPTFKHGTNVTFSCNTNYTLVGVTIRTCMDGNWSDENPTCYVNCEHEGQLYTQGSTRQEACNTCTCSNGLWACTQRMCLPADCTDPGTPLNGQQNGSPTFKHGTNATFSCNTNFTLVGVATITCMDGTWSDEKPTCHADCMDPGTPTSGEQDDSPTFEHGTNVTFSCNTNYTLVGVTIRTCMDGNWSDENPTCYVNCEHEGQLYTQGNTRQEDCNTCTCSNGVWACTQRICLPDIDECTTTDNRYNHRCDSKANCLNTPGSYDCVCSTGFVGNGLEECLDNNECFDDPCDSAAECHNTQGSYICLCKEGYIITDDGCEDVDECLSSPCKQKEQCINTPGSYICPCAPGYYEDVNNQCKAALSFDTTLTISSVGSMDLSQINNDLLNPSSTTFKEVTDVIIEDIGSLFTSSSLAQHYLSTTVQKFEFSDNGAVTHCVMNYKANSGVTLSDVTTALNSGLEEDGVLIGDQTRIVKDSFTISRTVIDHCAFGTHNCNKAEKCIFTADDKFKCECASGYSTEKSRPCTNIDECNTGAASCDPLTENCLDTEGSYKCVCISQFFKLDDECKPTKSFKGTLKLTNKEYNTDLNDSSSEKYRRLASLFIEGMRIIYSGSPSTRADYNGCEILGFKPGSVNVEHVLHFKEDTSIKSSDVENVLQEESPGKIDITGQISLVYDNDDLERTGYEENKDTACSRESTNDCHENATCIDNLPGGRFYCECKDGFEDLDPAGRGRSCAMKEEQVPEETQPNVFFALSITLGIMAFLILVGVVMIMMFYCRKMGKSPSKSREMSYWNTMHYPRERASDWMEEDDVISRASSVETSDKMEHLARVMDRAGRAEGFRIQRPEVYQPRSSRQFMRPYVATGTEERDANMQMITERRHELATLDQERPSELTFALQRRQNMMEQQEAGQPYMPQ